MTTELSSQTGTSPVTATPPAAADQAHAHFSAKLAYEADPADVAKAIAAGSPEFTLVDCRAAGNYTKAHLPNAVSLPWQDIAPDTVASLPPGLLVTYCWGPSCNAATKGAERLSGLGRQVKEMIGGIEYWIREGHPTEGRRPVVRGEERPADWGLVT
jgi:rhodanese-related sulfurtransferase